MQLKHIFRNTKKLDRRQIRSSFKKAPPERQKTLKSFGFLLLNQMTRISPLKDIKRCQAAENYVSKLDKNFKEIKESCNSGIKYNNKFVAMDLRPKSLSKI